MKNRKKAKGGKKSKQQMTVMFVVAFDDSFVFEPIVIWISKGPRCFKSLKDLLRPMSVHYSSNKKPRMDSYIMESVLSRFDRKMFWENSTCPPEILQLSLTNIKLV